MKIDWLEGTLLHRPIAECLDALKLLVSDWQDLPHGAMGYEFGATIFHTGRVFWSFQHPAMGVHVTLPSSALDRIGWSAEAMAADLERMGMKFTRVDVAADDLTGMLDLDVIGQTIRAGEFVTRWKRTGWTFFENGNGGRTYYFGSASSDSRLRIYDKAAEQMAKAGNAGQAVLHWIRVEMQLRNERAHAAVLEIIGNRIGWGEKAAEWIYGMLDFKEPGADTNRSRWTTVAWWQRFLNAVKKSRLFVSRHIPTAEELRQWVERQVTPSLYVLLEVPGWEAVLRMIGEGSGRLKDKHMQMIQMAMDGVAC